MRIKNAIERLRKQLKRKRGWLLASLIPLAVIAALLYSGTRSDDGDSSVSEAVTAKVDETGQREVVLHKLFICGEERESLGFYSEQEAEAMKIRHPEWRLEGIDEQKIIYAVEVDDLSPDCRNNAYFGLDSNNSLTLYDGKPGVGKVVRTFFQVDVKHLEDSLPEETVAALRTGIKITDFAEFNSVLSTFSDYALPEAEQVNDSL